MTMSKIEWLGPDGETWNPVTGCTKISAGCANCYAEKMTRRLQAMGQKKYVDGFDVVRCHGEELNRPHTWKKPFLVFVCSMSDLGHEDISEDFFRQVFSEMSGHPRHTFIVLTKRPEPMLWQAGQCGWPENVWCGVSVESADTLHRIEVLREIEDVPVRFISFEPLLGPIPKIDLSGIDWVIVGGESGPGARPMHPDWARGVRDQCIAQGVPFFFKQWGAFVSVIPFLQSKENIPNGRIRYVYGPNGHNMGMVWVGKKAAGRELDGRTWDEMPKGVENE